MLDVPSFGEFRGGDWPAPEGTLRFALVGVGDFTREWVAPAVEACEHATTTVVVSGDGGKANRVARELDAEHGLTYEQYADGAVVDAYDAAYVATPNALHAEHVAPAANRGKAVLCEKPLAADSEGAREIVETCQDADVPLMVAYRLQTDPVVRWARAAVRDGVVGDPVHATGTMSQDIFAAISPDADQWRLDPDLSGGAALRDLGIYLLNTLRFLVDAAPEHVTGATASPDDAFAGVDEHAAFTVRYGDGTLASVTASQQAGEASHLHLAGTEGELVLEPAFFGRVGVELAVDDAVVRYDAPAVDEIEREVAYFASHVLRDAPLEPDGRQGLEDVAALDAVYEAADAGRAVDVAEFL